MDGVLSEKGQIAVSSVNLDYWATASLSKYNENGRALMLEIIMTRKMTRSIIEIVAPPSLLVIVSWVNNMT